MFDAYLALENAINAVNDLQVISWSSDAGHTASILEALDKMYKLQDDLRKGLEIDE